MPRHGGKDPQGTSTSTIASLLVLGRDCPVQTSGTHNHLGSFMSLVPYYPQWCIAAA